MELGIGLPSFASDTHILPAERLQSYAQTAESLDFAGAWLIEHLLQPPTYATSQLDPLITLSTIAGATDSLPIGTSVLLLPLRNPVLVAKRAASLQHLADRRLTLGLGAGYVEAEFAAVGVDRDNRGERFREGIEILSRLFSEDTVSFDGDHFTLEDFKLEPTIRGPTPRLLAGGGGIERDGERFVPRGVRHRFAHADGWIAAPDTRENLEADWEDIAAYLENQGREPESLDRIALQYLHLEPGETERHVRRSQKKVYDGLVGPDRTAEYAMKSWLSGTVEQVKERLADYERQGFDQVILHPVAREPAAVDRQLRLFHEELQPAYR